MLGAPDGSGGYVRGTVGGILSRVEQFLVVLKGHDDES